MPSYCLKCRKNTGNMNPRVSNTSNGKTMIFQNVQYVVVKRFKDLKNKKQKEF